MLEYVQNKEKYFRNVDEETYYVIREFLHSEKVLKEINKTGEKVGLTKEQVHQLEEEQPQQGSRTGIL